MSLPSRIEKERAKKISEMWKKEIISVKNCTKCGKAFDESTGRFPYPQKQVLCKDCFQDSLHKGIKRLNVRLTGKRKLAVEGDK